MAEEQIFTGVLTALVTPMREDGAIDWATFERLIEAQISGGVAGLVPVGTTGESPTLDTDEHLQVIAETVRIAAGRVPVLAGTGANSTAEALHLTREADRIGADGFLQVTPYYNKPSQEGLFQHFSAIAACTDKPIVLYSVPGRCGVALENPTVARLAASHGNIRHIKEAGGDPGKAAQLKALAPEVVVLSGDDGLIAPFVAAGAAGVISVAANLAPRIIVDYLAACRAADSACADALYHKYAALLTELVFLDGNPVTIKEVLYIAGKIPSPTLRLPLVRTATANRERLRASLLKLGLLTA